MSNVVSIHSKKWQKLVEEIGLERAFLIKSTLAFITHKGLESEWDEYLNLLLKEPINELPN